MSQQGQSHGHGKRPSEGVGSSDVPFFRSQVEAIMSITSRLSLASRRLKNRRFRIREIERLLMQHKAVVYVLQLALAEELRADDKDGDESGGSASGLALRLRRGGGALTPETTTFSESEMDFGRVNGGEGRWSKWEG
jgi:hypothetical protein